MKHLTLIIAAVLGIVSGAVCAEVDDVKFNKVSVRVVQVDSPDVRYGRQLPFTPGKIASENRWVMVMVEYTPSYGEVIRGRTRSAAYNRHEQHYLDNVELKVRVVFESLNSQGQQQNVLFSGITRFWTMKLDDTRHVAVMFVPGRLIDRYYIQVPRAQKSRNRRNPGVKSVPMNRKLREDDLKVEAVFSIGGRELARSYCNMGGGNPRRIQEKFNQLIGAVPGHCVFDGAVLSKGQSPWAWYNVNNFDLERVAVPVR